MKIKEYSYKSATELCDIHAWRFLPDDEKVKCVVVMHHGMAEYTRRYYSYFEEMSQKGYALYMHDMASHGESVLADGVTGYFGETEGWKNLVKDMKTLFDIAKNDFPDKKIVISGHSMGSFIARAFLAFYNDASFDGAIIIGTSGPNPLTDFGLKTAKFVEKTLGSKHKSKLLDDLAFGSYGKKFEHRTKSDWLSKDFDVVDRYIRDPLCGYLFTAAGMEDLVRINSYTNSDEWYSKVSKELPLLLTSGAMDPVGEYKAGVTAVYDKLVETDHKKVSLKFYENCRHEILNEPERFDIYNDFDNWIETNILGGK